MIPCPTCGDERGISLSGVVFCPKCDNGEPRVGFGNLVMISPAYLDELQSAARRGEIVEAELRELRRRTEQIMYYATHQRWCQFNRSGDQQLCDCGFRAAYMAAVAALAARGDGESDG